MIQLTDYLANGRCNKNKTRTNHRIDRYINKFCKCLPIIHQFNYHPLMSILNLFNRKLNLSNLKSSKSNAKFNWKSFYFLIYLIWLSRINCVLIVQNSSVQNFTSTNHSTSVDQKIFKLTDLQLNRTQSTYQISNSQTINQSSNQISKKASYTSIDHLESSTNKLQTDLLNPKGQSINLFSTDSINYLSNLNSSNDFLNRSKVALNSVNSKTFSTIFNDNSQPLFELNKASSFNRSPVSNDQTNAFKTISLESNESKIKRRFADDESKIPKQDNNLTNNSSNFKIFQKKKDKIQQINNLEQAFDKLKARLSANSSTPIRQQKSIMQRQLLENSLQSTNTLPDNFKLYQFPSNEFDHIPEDQQYRIMSKKRFCELCFCATLGTEVLKCEKNNQIKFIPILPLADRKSITEIHFENQEGIVELNEESLKYYPNIKKLTIQKCGLKEIKERTFKNTPELKDINLKNNQIKNLVRKPFDDLHLRELLINGNPLTCSCTSKWIQLWINKTDYSEKLGADAQTLECTDYFLNKTQLLIEAVIKGCELPVVTINKSFIEVDEGQNFTVQCMVTGSPSPSLNWNTTELKSNFTVTLKTIENPQLNNNLTFNNTINGKNKNGNNKTLIKTLDVINANGSDNGFLACYSDNIVGKVIKKINLTINAAPKFEIFEKEQKYESYCIRYRITGHPLPTRTWYFNNTLLDFKKHKINDGKYVETTNLKVNNETKNNKRNPAFTFDGCLNVKTKTYNLSGNYTLKIQNKYGQSNRTINAVFLETYPEQKVPDVINSKSDSIQNSFDLRSNDLSSEFLLISSIGLLFLVFFIAAILYFFCSCSKKRTNNKDSKVVAQEKISFNLSRLVENPNYLEEKQQFLEIKGIDHIDSKCIQLVKPLGEGAFGRVYLGSLINGFNLNGVERVSVAVKVLKHVAEQSSFEFVREAEMLSGLSHDNIVKFYGISVDQHPFMMIFEFMKLGDLNSFLRSYDFQSNGSIIRKSSTNNSFPQFKNVTNTDNNNTDELKQFENDENYKLQDQNEDDAKESDLLITKNDLNKLTILDKKKFRDELRSFDIESMSDELINENLKYLTINDLFSISIQVCNGMKYLAEQHFLHRDLATRNCLVTDGIIVKIGDFGMSRDVYTSDYYKVGRQTVLPVRWMSPESLMYRKFTIESDVWSFGVLLWEIWTLGKQPFFELSNLEVIQQVIDGKKLDQPKHCPNEIFELMNKCWKYHALDRSSMAELFIQLKNFQRSYNEKNNLEV